MIPVININDVCHLLTPQSSLPFATRNPDGSIFTKNEAYAYFADQARRSGLQMFIAHYLGVKDGVADVALALDDACDVASNPQGVWRAHEGVPVRMVYDKFVDSNPRARQVKDYLEANDIRMLNPRLVEMVINDKMSQFEVFRRGHEAHFPPTRVLNPGIGGYAGLADLLKYLHSEVNKPPYKGAFMDRKFFIKPRSGTAGGRGIFKVKGPNSKVLDCLKKDIEYVVCPSVDFGAVPGLGVEGVHEIRIILVDGEPSIGFAKVPRTGDICAAKFSELIYFDLHDRPADAEFARSIDRRLSAVSPRICSVDFCYAKDGRRVVIEVNDTPGMDWAFGDKPDEVFSKKFMRDIVGALKRLHERRG